MCFLNIIAEIVVLLKPLSYTPDHFFQKMEHPRKQSSHGKVSPEFQIHFAKMFERVERSTRSALSRNDTEYTLQAESLEKYCDLVRQRNWQELGAMFETMDNATLSEQCLVLELMLLAGCEEKDLPAERAVLLTSLSEDDRACLGISLQLYTMVAEERDRTSGAVTKVTDLPPGTQERSTNDEQDRSNEVREEFRSGENRETKEHAE